MLEYMCAMLFACIVHYLGVELLCILGLVVTFLVQPSHLISSALRVGIGRSPQYAECMWCIRFAKSMGAVLCGQGG